MDGLRDNRGPVFPRVARIFGRSAAGEAMYRQIAVATDGSDNARAAEALAVSFAGRFGADLTGYHIYSGELHRMRFRALEGHLPPEYQKEDIIAYQRKIHEVLIGRGLEIISSEYMKGLRDASSEEGVPLHEVITDGKRSDLLCGATRGHDLMVIGAQGVGRIPGVAGLGSTSDRLARSSACDLLVARKGTLPREILVGIDGSDASFSGLETAIGIATRYRAGLFLLAVHNPDLHRAVFGLLSRVISREAGDVFRFREQEALHTRVIDQSLGELYQRHLERGAALARERDLAVRTRLGEGNPWHAICREAEERGSDLIVMGRHGLHRGERDPIGSNAIRVADHATTNVLIVGTDTAISERCILPQAGIPAADLPELVWTDEARQRLVHVPPFARPMAMLGIERYAREHEIVTITPDVMERARRTYGR